MQNKDFFDEEYSKLEQQHGNNQPPRDDSWFAQQPTMQSNLPQATNGGGNGTHNGSGVKSRKKSLFIILACIAIVASIALGWVLCSLVGIRTEAQLIDTAIDYLKKEVYFDIDNKAIVDAIEAAGTELMRAAGDDYGMLMSPQTFYDLENPQVEAPSSDGNFGFAVQAVNGIGLYVGEVLADTPAYGRLWAGDIIIKISNFTAMNGGTTVTVGEQGNEVEVTEIACNQLSAQYVLQALPQIKRATFHVLQNDQVQTHTLTRALATQNGNFRFVEYYFDANNTNLSIYPTNGALYSSYQLRSLSSKPSNVGYVRIKEFMDVEENGKLTDVASELETVLTTFRQLGLQYLVLDLKGNPGGDVVYTANIAGMLIHSNNLAQDQLRSVSGGGGGRLLVTTLKDRDDNVQKFTTTSSYYNYFQPEQNGKVNIVVWTDGGSASASELLTGALLDYKTAVHIGATTYGKGIAQTYRPLSFKGTYVDKHGVERTGSWGIYYTSAKYYSPLGSNIHGTGYTPTLSQFNNVFDYQTLWQRTTSYWNTPNA